MDDVLEQQRLAQEFPDHVKVTWACRLVSRDRGGTGVKNGDVVEVELGGC
jgi:hypothetical protein